MGGRRDLLRHAEDALWASLGVHPAEHRLHLPTLGIEVRIQELGSGRPVLFIHGGSTCGTSWADLAAAMPGFRCLLLDRPGTGASDPLPEPPTSLGQLAGVADTLVPDVLDALGLPSIDVVATSIGGWFALRPALSQPGRLGRIVIIGWTAGAPTARLPLALRVGTLPVIGRLAGRLPAGRKAVRSIFRSVGEGPALDSGRISSAAIDAYVALLRHTDTFANEQPLGRLLLKPPKTSSESPLLTSDERRRITAPVLFVWGDADPFGAADVATPFVAGFPNARLELVEAAGHAPWLDDPAIAGLLGPFPA